MSWLLALLATALLGVGAVGCGSTAKGRDSTSSSSGAVATGTSTTSPGSGTTSAQNHATAYRYPDHTKSEVDYGRAVGSADKQAVTQVVKRYYAAAAREDGAGACSMIAPSLAKIVAEDYGHGSQGPPYLRAGKTCPAVMTLLFKHSHNQLRAELTRLKVTRVLLIDRSDLAILSFGRVPEREIRVSREGRTWKIQSLLDSPLT